MTEMRTAIHNEGEAVYQCVPLGAHLAEVARLEAENKRLRDALEALLEATPQEECTEDCAEDNCPWKLARAALEG